MRTVGAYRNGGDAMLTYFIRQANGCLLVQRHSARIGRMLAPVVFLPALTAMRGHPVVRDHAATVGTLALRNSYWQLNNQGLVRELAAARAITVEYGDGLDHVFLREDVHDKLCGGTE